MNYKFYSAFSGSADPESPWLQCQLYLSINKVSNIQCPCQFQFVASAEIQSLNWPLQWIMTVDASEWWSGGTQLLRFDAVRFISSIIYPSFWKDEIQKNIYANNMYKENIPSSIYKTLLYAWVVVRPRWINVSDHVCDKSLSIVFILPYFTRKRCCRTTLFLILDNLRMAWSIKQTLRKLSRPGNWERVL